MPKIKNAKFSGYYFYVNTSLKGDFQICISVPLKESGINSLQKLLQKQPFSGQCFFSIKRYCLFCIVLVFNMTLNSFQYTKLNN